MPGCNGLVIRKVLIAKGLEKTLNVSYYFGAGFVGWVHIPQPQKRYVMLAVLVNVLVFVALVVFPTAAIVLNYLHHVERESAKQLAPASVRARVGMVEAAEA